LISHPVLLVGLEHWSSHPVLLVGLEHLISPPVLLVVWSIGVHTPC
jgi:hypothetical protein